MQTQAPRHLATAPQHLKPDGMADQLSVSPRFWPDLRSGKPGSFHYEYLVLTASFEQIWPAWEQR